MNTKRTKQIILISLVLLILGCSKHNPVEPKEIDLKTEALEFGLRVVKTYFEKDTTTYKTFFTDTLYFLEHWEEPIATSEINFTQWFSGFDYSQYTMDDYNDTYSPLVYEYEIYKDLIDTLTYWQTDSEDFLFLGWIVKEGKTEFMLDDLLVFMVSKRTGEWKIRAW